MRKEQSGFTLIELVVVIVILGILAATALPKFIDISTSANSAATQGVAGALGSAAAVNYGARTASSGNGVAVTNCPAVSNALVSMPTGYTIATTTVATGGGTASCVISGGGSQTASFIAIGIS